MADHSSTPPVSSLSVSYDGSTDTYYLQMQPTSDIFDVENIGCGIERGYNSTGDLSSITLYKYSENRWRDHPHFAFMAQLIDLINKKES